MTTMPVIKDSGDRREFETGANRDRGQGKGAFHLMPYEAVAEIAAIFEAGGIKYTPNNWRLGMPMSEYANSAIRHSIKAANGWDDENHAAMAAWNWIAFIQTRHMVAAGQLPAHLDDIHNWLTNDGVTEAMESVRRENQERKTKKALDASDTAKKFADVIADLAAKRQASVPCMPSVPSFPGERYGWPSVPPVATTWDGGDTGCSPVFFEIST